jgi:hypothetical protein
MGDAGVMMPDGGALERQAQRIGPKSGCRFSDQSDAQNNKRIGPKSGYRLSDESDARTIS